MIASSVVGLAGFTVYLSTVDPAWSVPANSLLLIVIALINWRTNQQVRVTKRIAKESHNELADALNGAAEDASVRKYRLRQETKGDLLRPEEKQEMAP